MAFQATNARQELQNKRILEDLQMKKQLLLKQGAANALNSNSLQSSNSTSQYGSSDPHYLPTGQRSHLQLANAQSFGYFVTQESSFEEHLQDLESFQNPKVHLEQYATSAHIAARMLHTAESCWQDIEGKLVGDVGSGCGTLVLGAAMLGAAACVGFEIDNEALFTARKNLEELELEGVDFVRCDVEDGLGDRWEKKFDTVLMNPPFGTKRNKGADMVFLQEGLRLATGAVYSLHKTSTRQHVVNKAKQWGVNAQVVAELRYDLPATYRFHKKHSVDIEVDFWRFTHKKDVAKQS